MRLIRRIWNLLAMLAFVPASGPTRAAEPVVVLPAASLKNAPDDATVGWTKASVDAAADPSVHVVATVPADSHPLIVDPAALIQDSCNPKASPLPYLRSPAARGFVERQGFTVIGKPGASE